MIRELCAERRTEAERVPLNRCRGRVLAAAVLAEEFVPGFDRSTVDGYAVRARDTFGCSDSLPAILTLSGQIQMGEEPEVPLLPGSLYPGAHGRSGSSGGGRHGDGGIQRRLWRRHRRDLEAGGPGPKPDF